MIGKYVSVLLVLLTMTISFAWAEGPKTVIQWEGEVARYEHLSRQDATNARHINALGFAYYKVNRLTDASAAFKKAIALDRNYPVFHNNLGTVYCSLKEYEKAEHAFRTALTLDPQYIKAAYNLSVALYRQQRYRDAYGAYQRAQKIDPEYTKKRFAASGGRRKVMKIMR